MKPVITYIRVSTDKQGRSGLGLEAQRAQISAFLAGGEILAEFVEIETAKGAAALTKRPQLAAALALAEKTGATLVVAKLDRLTRNVQFGATLMNGKVQFKVAELPHADNFMLHIMLAVAEQEREMISRRTIAALAVVKARGVQLGRPGQGAAADAFAAGLRAALEPIKHLSSRAIAAALNAQGVLTATGGTWSSVTVLRTCKRLEA
jgi:DNA invertase Pin-like site-specific DNA recombinase